MASVASSVAVVKADRGLYLKTQEFTSFLSDLRAALENKATMQSVVDSEVGRVLEKSLQETGRADSELIRKKWKNMKVITLNGKVQGLANKETGRLERFRGASGNALWAQIQAKRAAGLARDLAKVGASKRSWLELARKLGQAIAAPAYVQNAEVKGGVARSVDVTRSVGGNGDRYGLRIYNGFRVAFFDPAGGRTAFFSALAGRIGFFKKNMALGVYDSAKKAAAKHKGVLVKTAG